MQKNFCQLAQKVIKTEAAAVAALADRFDDQFELACQHLLSCDGRVVVIGMGKSGHIAGKIAATLASTGTPAFFVHPGEASHGDLGMITRKDVVLALSNSGETEEILTITPLINRLGIPLISIIGKPNSTLGRLSTVELDASVAEEACPLNLAPTSSTTACLAMGDALAITLLQARNFTKEDFAFAHPGGSLGRRLLLRVDEMMRVGEAIPRVHINDSLKDALVEMTNKRMGMTTIVDDADQVVGIYTDGDLRRTLDSSVDLNTTRIHQVMTATGKRIPLGTLAVEVLQVMEDNRITSLLVMDEHDKLAGVVHLHDLLSVKFS